MNPIFSSQELSTLHAALHALKMAELKKACSMLNIPDSGKKGALINRIMTFVTTGTITQSPCIPPQARAKNYPPQPLSPSAYMLYGSYKNDAVTRAFFKQLIGPHFHFTAFGIDWLEEHWLKGNPPTYQEFAEFWIQEYTKRKEQKSDPKQEWAFIRFVQEIKRMQPNPSHAYIIQAWKQKQAQEAQIAFTLLDRYCKNV